MYQDTVVSIFIIHKSETVTNHNSEKSHLMGKKQRKRACQLLHWLIH